MNGNIFATEDMTTVRLLPLGGGEVAVFSLRKMEADHINEDAAAVFNLTDHSGVIVVADGAGGMPSGGEAAAIAVSEIQKALAAAVGREEKVRTGILNGFENANRVIRERGNGAATTLVVVEVDGARIRPYHVGDSVAILVGQRGKLKWQTISHSPVGHAVESGLLDEEEAMHHEDRYLVSNLVGCAEMRIEMGPRVCMARRDTLLLASDGLLDNLHLEEIIERIRRGPLGPAAETLAQDCRRHLQAPTEGAPLKPDDLTFILYRCGTECFA